MEVLVNGAARYEVKNNTGCIMQIKKLGPPLPYPPNTAPRMHAQHHSPSRHSDILPTLIQLYIMIPAYHLV